MEENKVQSKKMTEKKAKKEPNFFVKAGRWIKSKVAGMVSELKKVTWPKFSKVLKQTGVVLVVVLFFLIVVTGIDRGLTALLSLAGK